MPEQNHFRHQPYPTVPRRSPSFHQLAADAGENTDFSRLHTECGVAHVVVVHGTFMGDDPFALSETLNAIAAGAPTLRKPLESLAAGLKKSIKPLTDDVVGDVGNYSPEFRDRFQELVGEDPNVELLDPTWSGQNHHLARADLAIRLLCFLADLSLQTEQKVLLWGHSHAGNGFAILSNLLANDRASVAQFFEAAQQKEPHWERAKQILTDAPSPHPLAQSVLIAAFGTPVRYGWDSTGFRKLVHVLHHRDDDHSGAITTRPLYPPHLLTQVASAAFGDWVQAFGIAGTDVSPPTSSAVNSALEELLAAGLEPPQIGFDTRFLPTESMRHLCCRWKTGTRCHVDGENLLVDYQPCGRRTTLGFPVEEAMFGHGVATTLDWLPAHLNLVLQKFTQNAAD